MAKVSSKYIRACLLMTILSICFAESDAGRTRCQRLSSSRKCGRPGRSCPECNENGKFSSQQCRGSTDRRCWCVNEDTGREITGTRRNSKSSSEENERCEDVETDCQRQAREADELEFIVGNFRPACGNDGNFAPQQCHGSTGHCWCVEIETGVEINGTRRGPGEEYVDCGGGGETDCQRQVREAGELGFIVGNFRPACDDDGNFNPRQCHGSTGYCWCVEIESGVEIEGTRRRPGQESNVDC